MVETQIQNSRARLPRFAARLAARVRIASGHSSSLKPAALLWIWATAFLGSLYFVGNALAYMTFAGVIQEFRLRYVFGIVFTAVFPMRCFIIAKYGTWPTRYGLGMYGVYAVITLIQILWYLPIANSGGEELYLSTIGNTIIASGIMAITTECVGILWQNGNTSRALWPVAVGFIASVSTLGLGVSLGWSATAEMRLLFQSENGETIFNYLALGDSIAVLGLLVMGLVRRPMFRLATLLAAGVSLFFAYSRTSFFLFLFCSIFILFVGGKHSQRIGIAAVIAILLSVIIAVAGESDALQPTIERMTVLLFNREADESYAVRKLILSEGLHYLRENWVMGRFMDEWWREGQGGGYIHNWLSFWQAYGIVPFLGSLTLFGATGAALWKQLLRPTPATGTAIALWMYAVLAIITARAYTWPYLWLAFGAISALTEARNSGYQNEPLKAAQGSAI